MLGVIWNCWGLAKPHSVKQLKAYVSAYRPYFIFLSETKIPADRARNTLNSLGYPFCTAISACNTGGGNYTWTNRQSPKTHIRERLDRGVANIAWRELFPKASVHHLPRTTSDHNALLLQLDGEIVMSGRPFKFEPMWLREPTCLDVIFSAWIKPQRGSEAFKLCARLREAKIALREWNKSVFGHIGRRINDLLTQIEQVQVLDPSPANLSKEAQLQLELAEHRQREELLWKQKSRIQWLQEGDGNNKFFHLSTITRRRHNAIDMLKLQSGWTRDREVIEREFYSFYESLFSASQVDPPANLEGLINPCISTEENRTLIAVPTHEEVKNVVFKMGANKAPGPDGMSGAFYKASWNFISGDVTSMVQSFFRSGHMLKQLNYTFISLIPKSPGASKVHHFRPIALCNFSYKVISKILANRLKPLMKRLISPCQAAFIPGRSINDNTIITKEIMHYMARKKGKQGVMAIKVDLAKAYDKVEWHFLLSILKCYGFDESFINLIKECITTVSYSILINGSPTERLVPYRGLRQGDPISPYLFIMCTEILSRLILRAADSDGLKGIRISPKCEEVHHLLFADDIIIFSTATSSNADRIQDCLDDFESWSGQQVNKQKSGIYLSKNTSLHVKRNIKEILNLKSLKKTDIHLGHNLIAKGTRRRDFQYIIDRMAARMSGWKKRLLSFAGRATVIKSVVQAIPMYSMQTHKVPLSFCDDMDKLTRDFWWGKKEDGEKSLYLRGWNRICTPKKFGGLGFKKARFQNQALLAKLSWQAILQQDSPWTKLLLAKYCNRAPFLEVKPRTYDSPIWKAILYGRQVINLGLLHKVGNGQNIDIWKMPWVPNHRSLQPKAVPIDIARTTIKPSKVSELIAGDGCSWRWDKIDTWFEDQPAAAIKKLQLPIFPSNDKIIWGATTNGMYSTSSGYLLLLDTYHPSGSLVESPNWIKIWSLNVLPRHRMLLWRLVTHCLPTMAAINKRVPQVNPLCPICSLEEEDEIHALMCCQRVRLVWLHIWNIDASSRGWNLEQCIEVILHPSVIGIPAERCLEFQISACTAIDKIWQWRNETSWGKRLLNPVQIIKEIQSTSSEIFLLKSLALHYPPALPQNQSSKFWSPPNLHQVKINFDASFKDGISLVAAVVRDASGTVQTAAIGSGYDATALHAETRAARLAMILGTNGNYSSFIIEGDNLQVILLLNDSRPPPWDLENCILDIKQLPGPLQCWTANHVYRTANNAAHLLAKEIGPTLPMQTFIYQVAGLPLSVYHAVQHDWHIWISHAAEAVT